MILFVDDEERRIQSYIDELESWGYAVKPIADVDEALIFFEDNLEKIDLLILDVMMPFGKSFGDNETKFGLKTGFSFYGKVRDLTKDLPVILFTNFSSLDSSVSKQIEQDERCFFLSKEKVYPKDLVTKITKEILVSK